MRTPSLAPFLGEGTIVAWASSVDRCGPALSPSKERILGAHMRGAQKIQSERGLGRDLSSFLKSVRAAFAAAAASASVLVGSSFMERKPDL